MITFHQHRKRWITVPVPTTQQSLNRAIDELRDESLTYESENRPLTHHFKGKRNFWVKVA